jgi:hypothetical protein
MVERFARSVLPSPWKVRGEFRLGSMEEMVLSVNQVEKKPMDRQINK